MLKKGEQDFKAEHMDERFLKRKNKYGYSLQDLRDFETEQNF